MTQTFSPSEAALSVMELTKRQPQFVMRYALLSAAVMAISMFIMASTGAGEALQRYVALSQSQQMPTVKQIEAILGPVAPALFFFLVANSILNAFLTGTALRKTIHDREVGFWGLQASSVETRFLLGSLAFTGVIFASTFLLAMVVSLLAILHPAVGAVAALGAIPALVWISLRLSQFGIMGVVNNSLGLTESFRQTDNKFWRYFGAYALWFVLTIILGSVVQAIATLGASALGSKIGSGLPASGADLFTAGWALYVLLYGMVTGFLNLGFVCIGAYAWHQSRGDLPPPKSDL